MNKKYIMGGKEPLFYTGVSERVFIQAYYELSIKAFTSVSTFNPYGT